MARRSSLILFYVCIAVLILITFAAPRGCTTNSLQTTAEPGGNLSVKLEPKTTIRKKIDQDSTSPKILAKSFSKNDWLFVVFYQYRIRVDLSYAAAAKGDEVEVQVNMPGQILSADADRIESRTAIWNLILGNEYEMNVVSRDLRWWLIILASVVVVLLLVSWISLRKAADNGRS